MVRCGLDVLLSNPKRIKGRKVALLINPTSCTSKLVPSYQILKEILGKDLVCIFGPEHGFRGEAQDQVGIYDYCLPDGTEVHSLYGHSPETLKPRKEHLEGIDLLIYDIQDVGARYYTYVYTLSYCMEACGEAGVEVMVLDRPNPIGGVAVEGTVLQPEFASFVGRFPVAVRHGLTTAELALMFRDRFGIDCELSVVKMRGWKRNMWFDDTGLPWVLPSPNMPTLDTATVYPGMCLLEGTNLSEGRGTTRPFEIFGAPWIDADAFARELNSLGLDGCVFRPCCFVPTFNKYRGQICSGAQIHITDRESFKPFLTGVAVVYTARKMYPELFRWRKGVYEFERKRLAFDLLCGTDSIRKMMEDGAELAEIEASWKRDEREFAELRGEYLLYGKGGSR